jgi:hypothetical protein
MSGKRSGLRDGRIPDLYQTIDQMWPGRPGGRKMLFPPLPGKLTPLDSDHKGGLMEQSDASLQRGGQS